jgi:hypothetical protein
MISKAETGNHSFSFKKTVEVTPEPEDYVDELLGYIEINNWPSTKRVNDISALQAKVDPLKIPETAKTK